MNCRQAQKSLDLYLDGRLPPSQRWAVDAHLSRCPRCRQAWLNLAGVGRALEDLGSAPAPRILLPRVLVLVAGQRGLRPDPRAWWLGLAYWMMGLLGALAGLALMGVANIFAEGIGLSVAQEPDLALESAASSLDAGLEGLSALMDGFLLGIADLELGLLAGGCLLLLSSGGLVLRALASRRSVRSLASNGGI